MSNKMRNKRHDVLRRVSGGATAPTTETITRSEDIQQTIYVNDTLKPIALNLDWAGNVNVMTSANRKV